MKNLRTFEEFLNESVKKYDGLEVYPDWIDPNRDFGNPIKDVKELKAGAEYILHEPGMNVWQAEYIYQGKKGRYHIFQSSSPHGDGVDMEYTEYQLEDEIKDKRVIKQN